MKKLILSLSVLAVTGAFAQKNARILKSQDLVKTAPKTSTAVQPIGKIMTTLWSDDFSTAANWTIDNSGQSGATFGWNINATSQGWWSATGISANGTSGGNNAEVVNGNPTLSPGTQALGVTYTMTTAQPINVSALGGSNQVSIQFKQFGARFNDLQEIQISTDGTTFTTVGDNLDKEVLSAAGGAPYPNPDTKLINLATVLSSAPTQLWIRFSWTTNFGGETNPNVWVTYGWYIDDVKIVTNPNNDLSINTNTWGTAGLNYYQIPTTQVAPISFSANVLNGGLDNLSSVVLKADVLTGGTTNVFAGSSAPTAIASLDTATLDVSTSFTPPATVATYSLKRKLELGTLPNGQILTGALTNGSTGYTTGNNVATTGGTGTGATVNIVTGSNGVPATGSLSSPGSGYTTANGVATTGGSGTGLTLDITASSIGVILGVDPVNQTFGVTTANNVPTTGGSGTGLTVNIISGGPGTADMLIQLTLNNGGTGYVNGDILTVTQSGGSFQIVVTATNGSIQSATILAGGTGYTVGDVVTIVGGSATYTVNTVSGGTITSVTVNNSGTGYTAGDVLNIVDGSATYTVATVTNNTPIVDEVPVNNTIPDLTFGVTNYIYARDNNVFAGATSNGTDGFEVGNLFDVWADQELKGINVRLAGGTGGTTIGTEVYAKIYSIDAAGEFAFLEETAPITVASNNLNTILTMVLLNPANLVAGQTYLAVVGSFDGGLRVSNAGSSEEQTSFFKDLATDTWFFTTSTPVVRLNFDPILSVNENTAQVADAVIYPNPTSSISTVEFNLVNASEATISITDLSGKIVSERNLGQLNAGANATEINTTSFNAGIYYVTVSSNGSSVTKKLIKN